MPVERSAAPSFIRRPYIFLGIFVCVGWLFFFFRSEVFEIQDVSVQASGGTITSTEVLPLVFQLLDTQSLRPWSGRHRAFLPKDLLQQGMEQALYAEKVEVGEIRNNVLRLNISFGSRFLYTTKDGESFIKTSIARPEGIVVTDPATLINAKKHYLAKDFTTQSVDGVIYVRNSTTTFETGFIKQILSLQQALNQQKVPYAYFSERKGSEVTIQVAVNQEVWLDLNNPLEPALSQLKYLLEKQKTDKGVIPTVIDLRIANRAYLR